MHDERAARAKRDSEALARLAAERVEREARHLGAERVEELGELGVVAQDVRGAELHQQLLGALEALVVGDEVDRADLEHVAQLDDRLADGQVGAVLDDRVARAQVAVVLEQAVRGAQRARARVVLRGQQLRGHLEQALRVGDRERRPAADGLEARVGQRDHPVLHLDDLLLLGLREAGQVLTVLRHRRVGPAEVLRGRHDDADALDAGDRRQRISSHLLRVRLNGGKSLRMVSGVCTRSRSSSLTHAASM